MIAIYTPEGYNHGFQQNSSFSIPNVEVRNDFLITPVKHVVVSLYAQYPSLTSILFSFRRIVSAHFPVAFLVYSLSSSSESNYFVFFFSLIF